MKDNETGEVVLGREEIQKVTTAVQALDKVSAGLAALNKQYGGVVFAVDTKDGMEEAKKARAAVRQPRYDVEHIRKEAKAPVLALGKRIDAEAERITTELLKIEGPIHQQIQNEEARVERVKAEEAAAAARREAEMQRQLTTLRGDRRVTASSGTASIRSYLTTLQDITIDDEAFKGYVERAKEAKAEGIIFYTELLTAAEAHEAVQARLAEERKQLEAEREEAAKRAAAERQQQEEAAAAERARLAEERAAAELGQARVGEIQAIQHQVYIASVGRAGVRKGGTRECITETLKETQVWPVTEEKFGPLLGVAQVAKANAIEKIQEVLAQWDADAAERERIAAEGRAAEAERARVAEQLRRQREADEAEALAERKRLAKERAELEERQAEEKRRREAEEAERAEAARIAALQKPEANAMVGVIATWYRAPHAKALEWLATTDWTKVTV